MSQFSRGDSGGNGGLPAPPPPPKLGSTKAWRTAAASLEEDDDLERSDQYRRTGSSSISHRLVAMAEAASPSEYNSYGSRSHRYEQHQEESSRWRIQSRSPPPRGRTRSPPPRGRTRSPPPRDRNRIAPPRGRSPSPPLRDRNRIAPPRGRSPSPPPRGRTRSPPPVSWLPDPVERSYSSRDAQSDYDRRDNRRRDDSNADHMATLDTLFRPRSSNISERMEYGSHDDTSYRRTRPSEVLDSSSRYDSISSRYDSASSRYDTTSPPRPSSTSSSHQKWIMQLPDQVLCCRCKVKFFDVNEKCGVVELLGSHDKTAWCFFNQESFLTDSADPIDRQLTPGRLLRVHGALMDRHCKIPYCASWIWSDTADICEDISKKYRIPTPKQEDTYIKTISRMIKSLEEKTEVYNPEDSLDLVHSHEGGQRRQSPPPVREPSSGATRNDGALPIDWKKDPKETDKEKAERMSNLLNKLKKTKRTDLSETMPQRTSPQEEPNRYGGPSQASPPHSQASSSATKWWPAVGSNIPTLNARTTLPTAVTSSHLGGQQSVHPNVYPRPAGSFYPPPPSVPTQPPVGYAAGAPLVANPYGFGVLPPPTVVAPHAAVPQHTLLPPPGVALPSMSAVPGSSASIYSAPPPVLTSATPQPSAPMASTTTTTVASRFSTPPPITSTGIPLTIPPPPKLIITKKAGGQVEYRDISNLIHLLDNPPPANDSTGHSTHRSKSRERRSRSKSRRSRSPGRGRMTRSRSRRRSRSWSRGRRHSPRGRERRSRSRGRERRSRSRGRERRSRSRGRERRTRSRGRVRRSRSRGRERRSRSRGRVMRTRSRSRGRDRRSASRTRDKRAGSGGRVVRTRSRSKSGSIGTLNREISSRIDEILGKSEFPTFLQHPLEQEGPSKKKKKKSKDKVKKSFALGRELALLELQEMSTGPDNIDANKYRIVSLEVEILDDGSYKQFTQIGMALLNYDTPAKQVTFFQTILPTYMEGYTHNLILKHELNLLSSLRLKKEESTQKYFFKKSEEDTQEPVSEQEALKSLVEFLQKNVDFLHGQQCIIFTLSRDTYLPLLFAKLKKYNLFHSMVPLVHGFCQYASFVKKLKMEQMFEGSNFQDWQDMYKQINGQPWPKDACLKDSVASHGEKCTRKLIADINKFLAKKNLSLNFGKFLQVFGVETFEDLATNGRFSDLAAFVMHQRCDDSLNFMTKASTTNIELCPSDRPSEVTIVELKKFECIDVEDDDDDAEHADTTKDATVEATKEKDFIKIHCCAVTNEIIVAGNPHEVTLVMDITRLKGSCTSVNIENYEDKVLDFSITEGVIGLEHKKPERRYKLSCKKVYSLKVDIACLEDISVTKGMVLATAKLCPSFVLDSSPVFDLEKLRKENEDSRNMDDIDMDALDFEPTQGDESDLSLSSEEDEEESDEVDNQTANGVSSHAEVVNDVVPLGGNTNADIIIDVPDKDEFIIKTEPENKPQKDSTQSSVPVKSSHDPLTSKEPAVPQTSEHVDTEGDTSIYSYPMIEAPANGSAVDTQPSDTASIPLANHENGVDKPLKNPLKIVPSRDRISLLSVKNVKELLISCNLSVTGLKKDLVERIVKFFEDNPESVPSQFLNEHDNSASNMSTKSNDETPVLPMPVAAKVNAPEPHANNMIESELENMNSKPKIIYEVNDESVQSNIVYVGEGESEQPSNNGTGTHNGGAQGDQQQSSAGVSFTSAAWGLQQEHKMTVQKKKDEISALESLNPTFHSTLHIIANEREVRFAIPGENILPCPMNELEIFFNDLNKKLVFVNYRKTADFEIKSQVCRVYLEGKIPHVSILINSNRNILPRMSYLFKIQPEKEEIHGSDTYYHLPRSDFIDDNAAFSLFKFGNPIPAVISKDLMLMPKTASREVCSVTLQPSQIEALTSGQMAAQVLINRSKDHSMNIGMRKMILVPSVLGILQVSEDKASVTVEVEIYNASKQRLRLSKKTGVAQIGLSKVPANFYEDKSQICSLAAVQALTLAPGDRMRTKCKLTPQPGQQNLIMTAQLPALILGVPKRSSLDFRVPFQGSVQTGVTVLSETPAGIEVEIEVYNETGGNLAVNTGMLMAEVLILPVPSETTST